MHRPLPLLAALALAACASPPQPPPASPPPAAPPADPAAARNALTVALASLSKRNFDLSNCAPTDLRIVDEAAARAGEPIGDRCVMLVARRADRTWLLNIRPATRAAPSQAGGSQALVTVTPGAEGVKHIEYVK
jgi:hypothetical protein